MKPSERIKEIATQDEFGILGAIAGMPDPRINAIIAYLDEQAELKQVK